MVFLKNRFDEAFNHPEAIWQNNWQVWIFAVYDATRNCARAKLSEIQEKVQIYNLRRNYVGTTHDNVSGLSPFINRRLILEQEIIEQTLNKHPFKKVEKFIQEVMWRSYWKGW